jgi:hypothetical protein
MWITGIWLAGIWLTGIWPTQCLDNHFIWSAINCLESHFMLLQPKVIRSDDIRLKDAKTPETQVAGSYQKVKHRWVRLKGQKGTDPLSCNLYYKRFYDRKLQS